MTNPSNTFILRRLHTEVKQFRLCPIAICPTIFSPDLSRRITVTLPIASIRVGYRDPHEHRNQRFLQGFRHCGVRADHTFSGRLPLPEVPNIIKLSRHMPARATVVRIWRHGDAATHHFAPSTIPP